MRDHAVYTSTGDHAVYTSTAERLGIPAPSMNVLNHEFSGKIALTGKDADVVINEISLIETLDSIQERLAILQPNPALEKEFAELANIRKEYVKLEKKLLEQKAAWEALKQDE